MELNTERAAETFARIVQKHQKAVFAVAYSKLGNVHDAEDVKQDVFVDLWRNMREVRNPEKIPAWLFKATINRCIDHFRKSSRRDKREAVFVESTSTSTPNQGPEHSDIQEAVLRAVSLLPEDIRTVIMLKHFVRLSYAEISKMTGLSKTTIDGRLRTGKKRMKEKLILMGFGTD